MAFVVLAPGRERSVLRRHPWVFSGAIARVEGNPAPGTGVEVRAADGTPLGWGAFSPASQIRVRLWHFEPSAGDVTPDFFASRLQAAVDARRAIAAQPGLDAFRLVNAESDGLPGVVVDRYGDFLVCQFLTAGAEHWKQAFVRGLTALARAPGSPVGPARGIYERSDVDARALEGLAPIAGVLAGAAPPDRLVIQEYGCRFAVQVQRGHKTGFYLDQRENRALLARYAAGADVLNCFAYTGGFGLWALRGEAKHVTHVEASAEALSLAAENLALNELDVTRVEAIEGDVFQVLRRMRDARRQFDLAVLDPPKFAEARGQVERAARGYKDINLLALKLLRPGGVLFTFSCSGAISAELFQKIVAGAAVDSGRPVQIERWLWQAPDHPVALAFPEGAYLKGLVCRVSA